MIGIGTIINTIAIILGGIIGLLLKKELSKKLENSLMFVTGLCVLFIGINGIAETAAYISNKTIMIIISILLGTLIGELLNIEDSFINLGEYLKTKSNNQGDKQFLKGFLSASLTVSIGAMAVLGSIKDGMQGDYSILLAKSIIDFIIILVMTSTLGKGCIFSFIPVFIFEGAMTAIAFMVGPFLKSLAITNLSIVGSMLIFCVGINLMFDKKIKVANMLPSLLIAILWAYLF